MKVFYSMLLFLIIFNHTSNAQLYSFSVNLNGKPSSQMLRSLQTNTIYISVDDLFDILEIPYRLNSEILQEEIQLNDGILIITAYNPFYFIKKRWD